MSKLSQARKKKNLSQAALAKAAGVSLKSITAYEQGWRALEDASIRTVTSLATVLEIDPYDLVSLPRPHSQT